MHRGGCTARPEPTHCHTQSSAFHSNKVVDNYDKGIVEHKVKCISGQLHFQLLIVVDNLISMVSRNMLVIPHPRYMHVHAPGCQSSRCQTSCAPKCSTVSLPPLRPPPHPRCLTCVGVIMWAWHTWGGGAHENPVICLCIHVYVADMLICH